MKDILEKIYNEEENIFYSILEDLLITNKKKFIITVNPEIIMKSYKNIEIKEMLLNDNNILVPDGISIIKKAKQYNINIKERITGVDISSKALEICNKNKKSIYLFGSKKEVLDNIAKTDNAAMYINNELDTYYARYGRRNETYNDYGS